MESKSVQEFDIAIMGGGILGYTTAFSILLKEPNIKLAIMGGKTRGMATLASGAMLGCYGEITKHSLRHNAGKIKHKMAVQAARKWPGWLEKVSDSTQDKLGMYQNLKINPGTFIILNAKARSLEQENFFAILGALKEQKEPYLEVDSSDIPGFNPANGCQLLKAIYMPDEGTIDSNYLLSALKKIISLSKNCTVFDEDVIKLYANTNQLAQIETYQGTSIKAKKFLLAAGAHSQALINQIHYLRNRVPPIFSGVGLSLLVSQADPQIIINIRTPNRAGACGLHVLPRGGNSLYIGATNKLHLTPKGNAKLDQVTFLLQTIEQINQSLCNSALINYSVGNRAVTLDTFPLIGKTSLDNLWILSGTYRDGFHLSPVLSEIIATEMLEKEPAISLPYHIFSPERFPIQTMTQEEAIKDTVDHYLSSAYEHNMKLPHNMYEDMLEEMFHKNLQNLYKKLDIKMAIPAELIGAFDVEKLPDFLNNYLQHVNENAPNTV